jgi:hypothetical protein
MKYSEIRGELKTGDLILFSGNDLLSKLIQLVTGSQWSHVGLVLVLHEYDFITLWESTTLSSEPDLITGLPRRGVQMVQLSSRLASYEGSFALKALNEPVDWAEHKLADLRLRLNGRDYERSPNELFKSVYDGKWGENKPDVSSVFCSELVVEAYKELGLLGTATPSNEYTPADLSRMRGLMGNYELGGAVKFKI